MNAKNMNFPLNAMLAIVALLLLPLKVDAFEVVTHGMLTKKAFEKFTGLDTEFYSAQHGVIARSMRSMGSSLAI